MLQLLLEPRKINPTKVKSHRNWTVVAAPVLIVDFCFADGALQPLGDYDVVKSPSFILLTRLVSNVPKAVLDALWIQKSKCIGKAHPQEIAKRLSLLRRKTGHLLVTLWIINIQVLMCDVEITCQNYWLAFHFKRLKIGSKI